MSGSNAIQPITPYQQPDVIGQAGQFAQLKNQLISNQANQQQLNARQAIGQAYSQSIDPATGQLDTNKLLANVAANPNAAWEAGDVAAQAQERALQQQQLSGMQLDQAIKRSQYVGNGLQALWGKANSPQGITGQDVIGQLGSAVADGIMKPQEAASYISDMPAGGAPLTQWLQNHIVNNGNTQQALTAMYGSTETLNNGAKQSVVRTNPVTGQVTPLANGTFNNQMTPGDANSPTPIGVTPSGQPIMGTKQQFVDQSTPQGPFGTGRYPTPGAQPGGGVVTAPSPADAAALPTIGANSAQQYNSMTNQAAQIPMQKSTLQNMLGALGPDGFVSGPGNMEWRSTIAGINRAFGTSIDSTGVASSEGFAKMSQQLANAQTAMLGAGSNEKLEASMAATPNPHLSVPGNTQIIHKLLGNQDAVAAWNAAGQNFAAKNGPSSFPQFVTTMQNNFDPRAFQLHYESPEEQADTLKSMSPSELAQFRSNYNTMASHGMFAQYQQAQPAQGQPAAAPAAAPQVPVSP
jgi:hypothetical protein